MKIAFRSIHLWLHADWDHWVTVISHWIKDYAHERSFILPRSRNTLKGKSSRFWDAKNVCYLARPKRTRKDLLAMNVHHTTNGGPPASSKKPNRAAAAMFPHLIAFSSSPITIMKLSFSCPDSSLAIQEFCVNRSSQQSLPTAAFSSIVIYSNYNCSFVWATNLVWLHFNKSRSKGAGPSASDVVALERSEIDFTSEISTRHAHLQKPLKNHRVLNVRSQADVSVRPRQRRLPGYHSTKHGVSPCFWDF